MNFLPTELLQSRPGATEHAADSSAPGAIMDVQLAPRDTIPFRHADISFGTLSADVAARVVAAAGDVALVLDGDGVIRDYALAGRELARENFGDLIDRPWIETVTADSRRKVEEMLHDAATARVGRWREVNHRLADGSSIAVRYMTVEAGDDGRVIAIGRDLRGAAAMQQRLLQAQQSMERDYLRLRQAESRYRLLFDLASEAILVADGDSDRLVEANPAARRLLGLDDRGLAGRSLPSELAEEDRETAAALLRAVANGAAPGPALVRVARGRECQLSATLFRQDRTAYLLIRLTPVVAERLVEADPRQMLLDVLERLPDAFVVTDESLSILAENTAFLELAHLGHREQARGSAARAFPRTAGDRPRPDRRAPEGA